MRVNGWLPERSVVIPNPGLENELAKQIEYERCRKFQNPAWLQAKLRLENIFFGDERRAELPVVGERVGRAAA